MPRRAPELSALAVTRLATPGLHAVGGVAGLYLQVNGSVARSWILRVVVGEKRRDMGLGAFPAVTLADARSRARELRLQIDSGLDPIESRRSAKSALLAAQRASLTFRDAAERYIDDKSPGWRNTKHVSQWRNTLATYAYPVLGDLLVRDVGQAHVESVLRPIWLSKTETASRLRGRMEAVLGWAGTRGYRSGDNPARWKGHLEHLFPAPGKVSKTVNFPAVPVAEAPLFVARLREQAGQAARALEFQVLTATRSGEVRGAVWAEMDLKTDTWIIPAARMKAGRVHRVPLSAAAKRILADRPRPLDDSLQVFQSPKGGMLSDMALTEVMRRMGSSDVPHGFRSTFKDWATEIADFPGEVSEMALAHKVSDKVEAAYRRGELLQKRRRLMDEWAAYLSGASQR